MSLFKRITTMFAAKANRAVDAAEDPAEMLDYSYERQLQMLREVKRGTVEVTAAKRRLEMQAEEQRAAAAKLDTQARQALAAGREDLARAVIERKQLALQRLEEFERQVTQLEAEQERLVAAEARLAAKVDAFKSRKEVVKAQYTAAKAQVRIGESISGISEEMTDIGYAIQRAEDKTQQLRARAGAIDELLASGALEDSLDQGTALDREIEQLGLSQSVEIELASMRAQIGAGPTVKQLEAGS